MLTLLVPIGFIAAVGVLVLLRVKQELTPLEGNFVAQVAQFDPLGSVLFFGGTVSLLIALQWGGTTYPFSDGRVITLFTVFGLCFIAFGLLEFFNQKHAISTSKIPLSWDR